MVEESRCNCLCFAEGALDVISKKWSLLVINALGNHQVLRYNELMKELGGISPKSLADTLAQLCKEGLVLKEPFAEIPPRVQYSLTEGGKELRKAVKPLLQWALNRNNDPRNGCVPRYKQAKAHLLERNSISDTDSDIGVSKRCSREV